MRKYKLSLTSSFKKDYKKIIKRHYDIQLLDRVVDTLLNGESLPEENKDHALTGKWNKYRECHIQPDWLLVYQYQEDKLVLSLSRTGTHSDLNL